MEKELHSLRMEKHVLGGILLHPDIFAEVDNFLSEQDFVNKAHSVIFLCLRDCLNKKDRVDKVILAEKVKSLGIAFRDEINIFEYIESISFTQISKEATLEAAKHLVALRIRRDLVHTSDKMKSTVYETIDRPIQEVLNTVDKVYGDKVSSYSVSEQPQNLFDGLDSLIEERGENIKDDPGLLTPYEEFNRLYGGLRPKNIYAIASRPGEGKTTWLNDLAMKTGLINGVEALILDTEMSREEMQFRMMSSVSGVPLHFIETGKWRRSEEYVKKIRSSYPVINKMKYHHLHVGNKDIDEVCSLTRRWHLSKVGRDNPSVIVYDYIKLTGEKVGQNWAEYQAIGEKVDKIKKLAEELNSPIITAIQLNRSGENTNRNSQNVTDDASAISITDRLLWFTSFMAIFRRKTADEISLDTQESGTHKLIPLKTRFQGEFAAGHFDFVHRTFPDGSKKLVRNYLNFNIHNFAVTELGSIKDSIRRQNAQIDISDSESNESELL
jgi:replicative DNA helicase